MALCFLIFFYARCSKGRILDNEKCRIGTKIETGQVLKSWEEER